MFLRLWQTWVYSDPGAIRNSSGSRQGLMGQMRANRESPVASQGECAQVKNWSMPIIAHRQFGTWCKLPRPKIEKNIGNKCPKPAHNLIAFVLSGARNAMQRLEKHS